MNFEPAGPLRTSTNLAAPRAADNGNGTLDPADGFETIGDLVADLIATIDLVPRDRLAAARGRAGIVGMAQALQDEGCVAPRRRRPVARPPPRLPVHRPRRGAGRRRAPPS